jgi:hypothetical protein
MNLRAAIHLLVTENAIYMPANKIVQTPKTLVFDESRVQIRHWEKSKNRFESPETVSISIHNQDEYGVIGNRSACIQGECCLLKG